MIVNSISINRIFGDTDFTDATMWDRVLEKVIYFSIKFVLALLILFIGGKIIKLFRKIIRKGLDRKGAELGVKQFLDSFIKASLYFILILMIAGFFGFQTTSLMALLGSAGVTLALALQGSLSNLTGGVLILILKPFKVGDYIVEDNKKNEGTVIEIKLFYTKLRTVDDKIVVLPNGTLANTSLTNVTASPERRIVLNVGISYKSDIAKAKAIIRELLEKNEMVIKDRPIKVVVESLDESQVTISAKYFVKNEDYFESQWYMTEHIKLEFDSRGVEIPFNQLDVHFDDNK